MTQRVAYMRTIRVISVDLLTCLNTRQRTAKLSRTAKGGNTVHAALSATNATQRLRGCTIRTSTSGLSATACAATRWISVPSITILGKRVSRTSSASNTSNRVKAQNFLTSTSCMRNCRRRSQMNRRGSCSRSSSSN